MINVQIRGLVFDFPDSEKELSFSEFEKKHKHSNFSPAGKDEVWKLLTGNNSTEDNFRVEKVEKALKKPKKAD